MFLQKVFNPVFVYSNNSIEISVLECAEKELFNFDKLTVETNESDSAVGQVCQTLQ